MSGVAKEDLVRMDADPFCPQPPRDETSNGRGKHSDDNQVDTGTNLECAGRYARIASRGYRREAHASTECEENESQSGSSNCTRCTNASPAVTKFRWLCMTPFGAPGVPD